MNVHALHRHQTRCAHGHFGKSGVPCSCGAPEASATEQQTQDGRPATNRPRLSLVKTQPVPALSLVTPIPLTLATDAGAAATDTSDTDDTLVLPVITPGDTSDAAQRPQEHAGDEQGGIAPALPVRPVLAPLPAADVAACRAAMNARAAGLQVRVMDWHGYGDGTATALLPDGTRIRYQPDARSIFAAAVPCPLGAHHYASIRGRRDLDVLRADADACNELHADLTEWPTAAARDISAAFAPRPVPTITPVLPLHDKDTQRDA